MKVESLTDMAKRQLEKWIFTDYLKPGQQIKEDEVATRLGISRPPVREAFKALESEGLAIRKPRKGVFVVKMDKADVIEVYMLKANLYAMATELALENITENQLEELDGLVEKMEACIHEDIPDILNYQKFHRKFHIRIMDIAGNRRLKIVASNLHKQIQRFSYQTLHYQAHLTKSVKYHKEIVERMDEKDKENACNIMKEHVLDAMNFLISLSSLFDQGVTRK
ncbi:GntR family transcriptional regulator [Desulfobacula sp.]|uniref:GntR family transcriptional regulator n=1 Tax=Desulfobacula sp. TaxID=2593537 RepID=UPI00260E27C7|nr:GntR family transcriptional regulator [Desulfobacula sp.]